MLLRILLLAVFSMAFAACRPAAEENPMTVTLIADGLKQTFSYSGAGTVAEFLADAQIELGNQDRISHPLLAPITDGMHITVRRVMETQTCQQEDILFERRFVPYEGIPAGEEQLAKSGQVGIQEACYRIIFEDGVESRRIPNGQPTMLTEPMDEIVYVGILDEVEPLAIMGTLSYINNGKPWTVKGNTSAKRPLIINGRLDSLVFDQNEDGTLLIYTAETTDTDDFFNQLWMIDTQGNSAPIKLAPTDVLYAEWRPQARRAIAYSTGAARQTRPPWKALNNLWLMDIDDNAGRALNIKELIPESDGGQYGWWGTDFGWSPQGDRIAWVRADAMGIVDFEAKELVTLLNYAAFDTSPSQLWLSPLSWSHDGQLIAFTLHSEPAETGPVFDLAVASADGRYAAQVKTAVGIWAAPSYSPAVNADSPQGWLAYLQAREPDSSIYSQYDLVVADRDGSNQRIVFPSASRAGMQMRGAGLSANPFAWSPDARFIAIVYQGNLWIVDVQSADSYQVTFDGGASNPVWTR